MALKSRKMALNRRSDIAWHRFQKKGKISNIRVLLLLGSCDFENGICGFKNEDTMDFEWTWHRGGTPTPNTGPTTDHTTNTKEGIFSEGRHPI